MASLWTPLYMITFILSFPPYPPGQVSWPITVTSALPFTLSSTLWKILTLLKPNSALSVLAPKELHVAEKSMRTAVLMGVTVNLWPHTSTELSVPCGSPTTFHAHFTLLFSHTSSSFRNFKHLLSSSHSTIFVLYITGKIRVIRRESLYISFAKLNDVPAYISSYSATLPVTDLSLLLPIANSLLVQQPPTTSPSM